MKVPVAVKKGWWYDFRDKYDSNVAAETNRGPIYDLVPSGGECPPEKVGSVRLGLAVSERELIAMGSQGYLDGEAQIEFKRLAGFRP